MGEIYMPNIFELVFAAERTRKPALQVGRSLLLKTFQGLGRFVRYAEMPAAIISHIGGCADYPDVAKELDTDDASAARPRGWLGHAGEQGRRG